MLKRAKSGILRLAHSTGVSHLLSGSAWRRRRLLILCYHGIAMYDEQEWSDLYVTPALLRRRLELLAEARCNVLPLGEAVRRLEEGSLPDRAVALTFDDGLHDFYRVAFPMIESFGFPVTLYLATYYMENQWAVFDPMCSYLLWRARDRGRLEWREVFPEPVALDEEGRRAVAAARIKQFALSGNLSGSEKDRLLAQLAARLEIDYQDLCRRRVLHLITPEEGRELVSRGLDVQYHTHRHRVYRNRDRMFAELEDNRKRIISLTSKEPRHFCYTGGFYLPEHLEHLKAYGILSATTCQPGFCTARTNPLLLPRLVDHMGLSDIEFRAWLEGAAGLLPHRPHTMSGGQLEEEATAPESPAPAIN